MECLRFKLSEFVCEQCNVSRFNVLMQIRGKNCFSKYSFPSFLAVLTSTLLLVASTAGFAQSDRSLGLHNEVRVGTTTVNTGVGMGAKYGNTYHNFAYATKSAIEFGLWQAGPGVFTLGGALGGSFSLGGYEDNYKSRVFVVNSRGAWHCGWNVPGLDTYAGWSAGVGFRNKEYSIRNTHTHYSHNDIVPAIGSFLGASYFVSPNFGFNVEMGYDITNIQVGVICRRQ